MSKYSLQGYLIALQVRTARTLMVEGSPDRTFVHHLLSTLDVQHVAKAKSFVIDMAGIVDGGVGLGARETVEAVHAAAVAAGIDFGGLVDREFRGFVCQPPLSDQVSAHSVFSNSLFWTRGHSIENYCFTKDAFWAFLRLQFPTCAIADVEDNLTGHFDWIIQRAAIVSVAAYTAQVVQRTAGLPSPQMWKRGATLLEFDSSMLAQALAGRGATPNQLQQFSAAIVNVTPDLSRLENLPLCRWLAHGRLGTEMIWAGIAKVLEEQGAIAEDVEQVANGFVDLKFKLAVAHWLAINVKDGVPVAGGEAPVELIAWLAA